MNSIIVLFFAFVFPVFAVAQAFWGYKLWHFFRIFPGFFAGLLISFTTGFLMFMDGVRGDLVRGGISFLEKFGMGNALANEISSGDILGVLLELIKSEDARNALIKILPDSAKAFIVFGVLVCIVCAIVCAAWEKPGVFLELFAYGYTFVASLFAATDSALLGAILGIVAGAILGALGYKISRGWIIVFSNLVDIVLLYMFSLAISLLHLLVIFVIPVGIYKQFKATAAPKDGVTQPAAASSGGLKSKLTAKFKPAQAPASDTDFVPMVPSARADTASSERTSQPGGPKFCPQCGNPLAPGAKFCTKCGASTQRR